MSRRVMARPRKKKMGRPLEDVPLRKLVKSIRHDIDRKLSELEPGEAASNIRKPKRK
jgi:hypothetical protein